MPQLDRLIDALVKHSAEALLLSRDEQPALQIAGTPRPILKTPLDAGLLLRLVSEIAPQDERAAVAAGRDSSFVYTVDGTTVRVEVSAGPKAVVRVEKSATRPQNPAVATKSEPQAVSGGLTMDGLFHKLVERGGSDLHISTGARPMLRVDGEMEIRTDLPEMDAAAAETLLLQIAPDRNREQFAELGDTDFAYEIEGLARFRCNLFRDRKGIGGVFRVIPSKILTVEQLGLSRHIRELANLTKGLVLVTGPTGSGKSTTLAAIIDLVNATRPDHIITIEDPIEFVHPNKKCLINQREVHIHTQGFKSALRAALREDPDVVLVGEMRDLETVAIALETAETGHLVFGTLHTSSAISTIDRLIDQFPADQQAQIRIMLAESLKAVISQVLCKKIGGGRAAAQEVLMVTPAVSNLIREGKTFQVLSLIQTGRKLGMTTMKDTLLQMVESKIIEPHEAYLKAIDKASLVAAFRAKGIQIDVGDHDDAGVPKKPAHAGSGKS